MDTRCEPSCLSQISPRDSERPSRPLVESSRVHSMYYVLHTRDSERDPPVLLHCRVVLSCAVQCSVPLQTTNYRVHLTSFQETRRGPPVLLHCRVESLYNVHVLSKKSVEYPYILKAKKLADSAFSVQNNWRKRCVYLDDSICAKNA